MKNVLAIIPCRKGSKGIKDKNIYPLCGKPLVEYTIDVAKKCNLDYVITTDDERIRNNYLFTIERPKKLAGDKAHIIDEVKRIDKNKALQHDYYMILQPTSPLRCVEHVIEAYKFFVESNVSSLYSGYIMGIKNKNKIYDKHTSEKHFQRNGAIFIAKRELILEGKLWDDDAFEYEMPKSFSVDIDDMDDMYVAESLILNGILEEDDYEEEEE